MVGPRKNLPFDPESDPPFRDEFPAEEMASDLVAGLSNLLPQESREEVDRRIQDMRRPLFGKGVIARIDAWISDQAALRVRQVVSQLQDVLGRIAEDWLLASASIIGPDFRNRYLRTVAAYRGREYRVSIADQSGHPFVQSAVSGLPQTHNSLTTDSARNWGIPGTQSLHVHPLRCRSASRRHRTRWLLVLESRFGDAFVKLKQLSPILKRDLRELEFMVSSLEGLQADSARPRIWAPLVDGWLPTQALNRFCKRASAALSGASQAWAVSMLHVDTRQRLIWARGTAGFDYALLRPRHDQVLDDTCYTYQKVFLRQLGEVVVGSPDERSFHNSAKARNMGMQEIVSIPIPSKLRTKLCSKSGVLHLFRFLDIPKSRHLPCELVQGIAGRAGMVWDGYNRARLQLARRYLTWKLMVVETSLRSSLADSTQSLKRAHYIRHFMLMCILREVLAADAVTIDWRPSADGPFRALCTTGQTEGETVSGAKEIQIPKLDQEANQPVHDWFAAHPGIVVRLMSIEFPGRNAELSQLDNFPIDAIQYENRELLLSPSEDRRFLGVGVKRSSGPTKEIVKVFRSCDSPPYTIEDGHLLTALLRLAQRKRCFADPDAVPPATPADEPSC